MTLDLRPSGCPRPGSAWLERQRADHDHYIALDVTYLAYQDVIDAFQHTDWWTSKRGMQKVNEQLRKVLPEGLEELARLGQDAVARMGSGAGVIQAWRRIERSGRSDQRPRLSLALRVHKTPQNQVLLIRGLSITSIHLRTDSRRCRKA